LARLSSTGASGGENRRHRLASCRRQEAGGRIKEDGERRQPKEERRQ
jgi:hypothetical protein